jgi:small subunit ribosomal protein S20
LANHKSEIKRARQNIIKNLRNKATKTKVNNSIKKVLYCVNNEPENASSELVTAKAVIDRAAQKGVIHKNNAARKISRLAKHVNAVLT